MKHLFALPLLLLIAACGQKPAAPTPDADTPRPAKLLQIQAALPPGSYTFPAVLRARESVDLAFDVPGTLASLDVTEGRAVERGTLLAALDKTDFIAKVSSATTAAELAAVELARFEQLQGSVAPAEIDRKRAAAATYAVELATAQNALDKTELRAPFDGVVSRRIAQNFSAVQAKQPILLYQALSPLDVVIDVPEPLLLRAKPGAGEGLHASLRFESRPGQTFDIVFREVATSADPQTQTYAVVFSLERPKDMTVLPGMTAVVELLDEKAPAETVFLLPPLAVMGSAEGTPKVWVVDPATGAVSAREVTLGRPRGDALEVRTGLTEGETVVSAGVSQLREGMRVRPLTP
jgi:RND family efflux transporter MFP subunit